MVCRTDRHDRGLTLVQLMMVMAVFGVVVAILACVIHARLEPSLLLSIGRNMRGAAIEEQLARNVLNSPARTRSLEYLGGSRVRLERLQIAWGATQSETALITGGELDVDVPGMRLHGFMDLAPVIQSALAHYLTSFNLEKRLTIPAQVLIPMGGIESLKNWTFSMDLFGAILTWAPLPGLAPVPFNLNGGKIEYSGGTLALKDLSVGLGDSHITANVKFPNVEMLKMVTSLLMQIRNSSSNVKRM